MRGKMMLAMLAAVVMLAVMPNLAAADGGAKYGQSTAVLGDTAVNFNPIHTHPSPMRGTFSTATLNTWPSDSRMIAQDLISTYGQPTSWNNDILHWDNIGPWDYVAVHRTPVSHSWPYQHKEVLQAGIYMDIPSQHQRNLSTLGVQYDPNLNLAFVPAESEEQAFLAFNIGNEVLAGRLTPTEAQRQFSTINNAFVTANTIHPYTTALNFTPGVVAGVTRTQGYDRTDKRHHSTDKRNYSRDHKRTRVMGDTRTRGTQMCRVWDPCSGCWVSAPCSVTNRSAWRGNWSNRYASDAYSRGPLATRSGYYTTDEFGQRIWVDGGVVAGFSGMNFPTRSMAELDRQRIAEYERIFGPTRYSKGTNMGPRYVYWTERNLPWPNNEGWVIVNGERRWVSANDLRWHNNRWVWNDDPSGDLRFEVTDDISFNWDRLEVDPDRFNIDADRLKPDPDIF